MYNYRFEIFSHDFPGTKQALIQTEQELLTVQSGSSEAKFFRISYYL